MEQNTTPPAGAIEVGSRHQVTIERMAALGRGVANIGGLTLLVSRGVPGETVEVEITRVFHNHLQARALGVVTPSLERVEPVCPHFDQCGGCDWQHINYSAQLDFKHQALKDQLQRIGKMTPPPGWTLRPADSPLRYRDKLEFTPVPDPDGQGWSPGFHPYRGETPVPIAQCHLAPEAHTRLAKAALDLCTQLGLLPETGTPNTQPATGTPTTPPETGTPTTQPEQGAQPTDSKDAPLQRLGVHSAGSTGNNGSPQSPDATEAAPGLALVLYLRDAMTLRHFESKAKALVTGLKSDFPELNTLVFHARRPQRKGGPLVSTPLGTKTFLKTIGDTTYQVPATGFFQVNPQGAAALTEHVVDTTATLYRQWLETAPVYENGKPIMDLFCGVGLFSLPLAARGLPLVGLEGDHDSVMAADDTAEARQLKQCAFRQGDLDRPETLGRLYGEYGAPSVVIVDPPRRGMSNVLSQWLLDTKPSAIVYVSCDGGTFARDAGRLSAHYQLETMRGFDLFPQTHHLEIVGVFRLLPE